VIMAGIIALGCAISQPMSAKGRTVKIVITGPGLPAPIEIGEANAANFGIWEGPGVFINGVEQTTGFIIEWPRGIVEEPPATLTRYEVLFYAGCRAGEAGCRNAEPEMVYRVSYAYDRSTRQGFVYLPGSNTAVMLHGHGYERHWLRATAKWDSLVWPLIAPK